jgi:hypothetical protein
MDWWRPPMRRTHRILSIWLLVHFVWNSNDKVTCVGRFKTKKRNIAACYSTTLGLLTHRHRTCAWPIRLLRVFSGCTSFTRCPFCSRKGRRKLHNGEDKREGFRVLLPSSVAFVVRLHRHSWCHASLDFWLGSISLSVHITVGFSHDHLDIQICVIKFYTKGSPYTLKSQVSV